MITKNKGGKLSCLIFLNLRKVAAPAVTLSALVPVIAPGDQVTDTDLALAMVPVAVLCAPVPAMDQVMVAALPSAPVPPMDRVTVPVMDTKKKHPVKLLNAVLERAEDSPFYS